ncbi:AraC family transcriptional regulator [Alkalicoccobacillus gibsonii]|uniref:AraC family transcriptional regulator n=1 Tax=Alkalicoccobacillus gibsonii TaxID=79881 RepID=UPI001933E832|nr:AraC family transcriptional regulator [Alkalicoccobacillus gibsonii]MBM0065559.1 AraC family transcriptional regulator [Alkalicoccobacillus gibsonii]
MRYSYKARLILYGALISIIPVLIVGVFSYNQSINQVEEKVSNENVEFIQQMRSNIEQTLSIVSHSVDVLVDSQTINEALRRPLIAEDFKLLDNMKGDFIRLQSLGTKVEEVIMVNTEQNWIVKNDGLKRLDQHSDLGNYESLMNIENDMGWVLLKNDEFSDDLINRECAYTIGLVKKLPEKTINKTSMVLANIPMCTLLDMIADNNGLGEKFVLDRNGNILIDQNIDNIGQSLLDIGYNQGLPSELKEVGQYQTEVNGDEHVVTYATSPDNNWTYVYSASLKELTKESNAIGWFTFIIVASIILFCLLAVWVISRNLYRPINNLLHLARQSQSVPVTANNNDVAEIERHLNELFDSKAGLEKDIHKHLKQSVLFFLRSYYEGKTFDPIEVNEKRKIYKLDEKIDSWDTMTMIILRYDYDHQLKDEELSVPQDEWHTFAIKNIVEEVIQEPNRLPTVWNDRSLLILIGQEGSPEEISQFSYKVTELIHDYIDKYLKLPISIGVSEPFTDFTHAPSALQEGKEALAHRLKYEQNVVIFYESIKSRSRKKLADYQYPKKVEGELMLALREGDSSNAHTLFDDWINSIFDKAEFLGEYQVSFNQLLTKLLRLRQESGLYQTKLEDRTEADLYKELLKLHRKEDVRAWFKKNLLKPLLDRFNTIHDSQYQQLADRMIVYVQEHYDKELTLESCAAHLHYNANYLSTVFKQSTGKTFSEYVTYYRFEMAKHFLSETTKPVKEIAEKLQYNNSQNFIRSFKKLEGVTPGQYRTDNRRDHTIHSKNG